MRSFLSQVSVDSSGFKDCVGIWEENVDRAYLNATEEQNATPGYNAKSTDFLVSSNMYPLKGLNPRVQETCFNSRSVQISN